MEKVYIPYFEAVKQILDGKPVKNLDEIRTKCNKRFLKGTPQKLSEKLRGYHPELIIISFIADSENKILMGASSSEMYGDFQRPESINLRRRGRQFLEATVQRYLN